MVNRYVDPYGSYVNPYSIGMHRESESAINIIECLGDPEQCIKESITKRG